MELLCLKNGDSYLRITSNTCSLTALKDASVFQVTDVNIVKFYYNTFKESMENLTIVKLTISEEEFKA